MFLHKNAYAYAHLALLYTTRLSKRLVFIKLVAYSALVWSQALCSVSAATNKNKFLQFQNSQLMSSLGLNRSNQKSVIQ